MPPPNPSPSPSSSVSISAHTIQGPRNHQEDRYTIISHFTAIKDHDASFIAVYDGHSSFRGSQTASTLLPQLYASQPAITNITSTSSNDEDVVKAIKKAFIQADKSIIMEAADRDENYGTTATAVLKVDNILYVAHAGDSRAILVRNGQAIQLTEDHKPASVTRERERIEKRGGKILYCRDRVMSNPESGTVNIGASGAIGGGGGSSSTNDGDEGTTATTTKAIRKASNLNMSRALGDLSHKLPRKLVTAEPDVLKVELERGEDEAVILATDGLTDVVSLEQAALVITKALEIGGDRGIRGEEVAEKAAKALVEVAEMQGVMDNATALVMMLKW
jgi:serine/threonine protein phosphatase PrpC